MAQIQKTPDIALVIDTTDRGATNIKREKLEVNENGRKDQRTKEEASQVAKTDR